MAALPLFANAIFTASSIFSCVWHIGTCKLLKQVAASKLGPLLVGEIFSPITLAPSAATLSAPVQNLIKLPLSSLGSFSRAFHMSYAVP